MVIVIISGKIQNAVCNKIFSGAVAFYDRTHHILWNIIVICKKLFCIFWQTVTTVAKGRIVVMAADSGIETDTIYDVPGV